MWPLSFISEEDFTKHVQNTIKKYDKKLQSYDLSRLNSNIIDPIKLLFDKSVYQVSWEEIIKNEIFRQRDKASNNDIGYFHQELFQYLAHCTVPKEGWDVIFSKEQGIDLPDGNRVQTVYVEMKNKHNTMNSASSGNTYMKMQNQLLNNDSCACFLVEIIAKKSQNITWAVTKEKQKLSHKLIRRVSIDQFYALVTGQNDAFYQMCRILPCAIQKALKSLDSSLIPQDTAFAEIQATIADSAKRQDDVSIALAFFMLGFSSYSGFNTAQ